MHKDDLGTGSVALEVSRADGGRQRLVERPDGVWLEVEGSSVDEAIEGPWSSIEEAIAAVPSVLNLSGGDQVESCMIDDILLMRFVQGDGVWIDGIEWRFEGEDVGALPHPGDMWSIASASNGDDYGHPGGDWSSALCCIGDVYFIDDEDGLYDRIERFSDMDLAVRWWLDGLPAEVITIDEIVGRLDVEDDLLDDAYRLVAAHCGIDAIAEIGGRPIFMKAALENRWWEEDVDEAVVAELEQIRSGRGGQSRERVYPLQLEAHEAEAAEGQAPMGTGMGQMWADAFERWGDAE